jgi:hypothetical protein
MTMLTKTTMKTREVSGPGLLARGRPLTGRRLRQRRVRILPAPALVAALIALSGSGCASAGKLAEYDFRDRTVGVVALGSPRPEILTDAELDLSFANPLQAALRIGADVVKEVGAVRARGRLDEAALEADVPGRMMDRVLQGVAGELRATPVEDARRAEFELEVVVKRYGIDAEAWLGPAHFFIESEVILREAATGRRIWKGKVTEREAISPVLFGTPGLGWQEQAIANDVITAAGLASLSPEAMVRMLEALADFSADRVLRSFRRGLEKSRARG